MKAKRARDEAQENTASKAAKKRKPAPEGVPLLHTHFHICEPADMSMGAVAMHSSTPIQLQRKVTVRTMAMVQLRYWMAAVTRIRRATRIRNSLLVMMRTHSSL